MILALCLAQTMWAEWPVLYCCVLFLVILTDMCRSVWDCSGARSQMLSSDAVRFTMLLQHFFNFASSFGLMGMFSVCALIGIKSTT